MLCRCIRNCYRRGRYWKEGQEHEFDSCPPSFQPVPAAAAETSVEVPPPREPILPMETEAEDLPGGNGVPPFPPEEWTEPEQPKPKRQRKKKQTAEPEHTDE